MKSKALSVWVSLGYPLFLLSAYNLHFCFDCFSRRLLLLSLCMFSLCHSIFLKSLTYLSELKITEWHTSCSHEIITHILILHNASVDIWINGKYYVFSVAVRIFEKGKERWKMKLRTDLILMAANISWWCSQIYC